MQNILYIPEQTPGTSSVLELLAKRGFTHTEVPLFALDVRQAYDADYFLYIFDIKKEIHRSLGVVAELRDLAMLAGRKGPPLLFVVEKNIAGFEQAARSVPIDFYCTAPLEERYFYHAIAQALIAS